MTLADTPSEETLPAKSATAPEVVALRQEVAELKHQLDWFKRQLFGSKSEKRIIDNPDQQSLFSNDATPAIEEKYQTVTYQRGKGKKNRPDECVTDSGLRFDDTVPVKHIILPVLGIQGLSEDEYEIIGTQHIYRLAQQPASYTVLHYEQPVAKIRSTQKIEKAITPMSVFDQSIADVSLLSGLLVDKFVYHLPLYRQHQRIEGSGVTLSRSTLTNLVRRSIELLVPIADAQRENILLSRVLAMDETPIKVGKSKSKRGKMHQGYYWPVYGELDEVSFIYADSRAHEHVETIIRESFEGTIVSDGYAAYARFAQHNDKTTHAQCWVHTRRQFVEAENDEPVAVKEVLSLIAILYVIEEQINKDKLCGKSKREYRLKHSKPVVEQIISWVHEQRQKKYLLPKSPFAKALLYLANRETELQVFLSDPDVPIDTNHLERLIRPIAMGRRNWLFCWSELGAKHVGVIQSLISTCKLHGIDPYRYLVDVLQRVQIHPNSKIIELTPRLWKHHFAEDPMRSDLALDVHYAVK